VSADHVETRKGAKQIAAILTDMIKTVPGIFAILCLVGLDGCASNPVPPPNAVSATFDPATQAVQIVVSYAQAPLGAALISQDGRRYTIPLTLVSAPHVNYCAPPSVGLGLPFGSPRPTSVDDQYVASIRFAAPADYALRYQPTTSRFGSEHSRS
jgi:hypothetical protein